MTDRQKLLAQIKGNPELIERLLMVAETTADRTKVLSDDAAARHLMPMLAGHTDERLVVLALNRRRVVTDQTVLTTGTDCFTIVDPKQILRWALTSGRSAPSAIILGHNHPSGDPTPSRQDIEVTRRVEQACKAVGIQLLDHLVICGPSTWSSLASMGYISMVNNNAVGWTG